MKLIGKALAGAAIAAAFATSAQAITVGGVTWDETQIVDFFASPLKIHQQINPVTGELSGWGRIMEINGDGGAFNGGQLMFKFSGYTGDGTIPVPGTVTNIPYSGGKIEVWYTPSVIAPINAVNYNDSNYKNGTSSLFLELEGHEIGGVSLTGTVEASGSSFLLSGLGYLDIVGGDAAAALDTNSKNDGSDFAFTTTLNQFYNAAGTAQTSTSFLNGAGSGDLSGLTATQVPEPGSLALMGLGLGIFGMMASRRRRASK